MQYIEILWGFFHGSFLSCAIKRMFKSYIRRKLFEMLSLRGLVFLCFEFFLLKIPGFLTKNIIRYLDCEFVFQYMVSLNKAQISMHLSIL